MKKHLVRGFGFAAALALLALPSVGHASSLQIKGYDTATFKYPGSSATHQGGNKPWDITTVNTGGSKFTWGKAASGGQNGSRNYLEFKPINATSDNQFDTFTDTPINLGQLKYFNGITQTGSNVSTVDLLVTLNLTVPNIAAQDYNFHFQMLSRTNPRPDDVTFTSPVSSTTFNVDGTDYTLKLLGFSDDGGLTFRQAFLSQGEGKLSSTHLWAVVTADFPDNPNPPGAVPEPTSIVSATAGLIGLGLLARRRRKGGKA